MTGYQGLNDEFKRAAIWSRGNTTYLQELTSTFLLPTLVVTALNTFDVFVGNRVT